MSIRRRGALLALVAIVFVGLGLTGDASAHARSSHTRRDQIATHSIRVAAGTTAHADRRGQLDRVGWLAHLSGRAAGWVRVLTPVTVSADTVEPTTWCRSRAPPA